MYVIWNVLQFGLLSVVETHYIYLNKLEELKKKHKRTNFRYNLVMTFMLLNVILYYIYFSIR